MKASFKSLKFKIVSDTIVKQITNLLGKQSKRKFIDEMKLDGDECSNNTAHVLISHIISNSFSELIIY